MLAGRGPISAKSDAHKGGGSPRSADADRALTAIDIQLTIIISVNYA
jgi:hypothetical protein